MTLGFRRAPRRAKGATIGARFALLAVVASLIGATDAAQAATITPLAGADALSLNWSVNLAYHLDLTADSTYMLVNTATGISRAIGSSIAGSSSQIGDQIPRLADNGTVAYLASFSATNSGSGMPYVLTTSDSVAHPAYTPPDGAYVNAPVVSEDGNRVAFMVDTAPGVFPNIVRMRALHVYDVGSRTDQIVMSWSDADVGTLYPGNLQWISATGTTAYISSYCTVMAPGTACTFDGVAQLTLSSPASPRFLVPPPGAQPFALISGLSADASRLTAQVAGRDYLYNSAANSSATTPITRNGQQCFVNHWSADISAVFSANGHFFACNWYSADRQSSEFELVNTTDGSAVTIESGTGSDFPLWIANDGQSALFLSSKSQFGSYMWTASGATSPPAGGIAQPPPGGAFPPGLFTPPPGRLTVGPPTPVSLLPVAGAPGHANACKSPAASGKQISLFTYGTTLMIGTAATLTANVTTVGPLIGQLGKKVTFKVDCGPSIGKTAMSKTDVHGQTSFSYQGPKGPGTDTISASFVDTAGKTERAVVMIKWVLPPAIVNPCARPASTRIGARLLASLKCTTAQLILGGQCAISVVGLVFIPLKAVKLATTAKGLLDFSKLDKAFRPAAKLYNKLSVVKYVANAPPGFRTPKDVLDRIMNVVKVDQLIDLLPDLRRAVSEADFNQIALYVSEVADLKPCVQGLVNALQ